MATDNPRKWAEHGKSMAQELELRALRRMLSGYQFGAGVVLLKFHSWGL